MAYDDSVGWIPIQDGTEVKNMYTLVNNAFFENKAVQFDVYNGYITDTQYYIPRENPDTKF